MDLPKKKKNKNRKFYLSASILPNRIRLLKCVREVIRMDEYIKLNCQETSLKYYKLVRFAEINFLQI